MISQDASSRSSQRPPGLAAQLAVLVPVHPVPVYARTRPGRDCRNNCGAGQKSLTCCPVKAALKAESTGSRIRIHAVRDTTLLRCSQEWWELDGPRSLDELPAAAAQIPGLPLQIPASPADGERVGVHQRYKLHRSIVMTSHRYVLD